MKIILHIDDDNCWVKVLHNLENLVTAKQTTHPDLEVEVVANADAVKSILKETATDDTKAKFEQIADAGMRLCACHHSLERIHATKDDVLNSFTVVPAGVIEIAERETEGFCYIKP